jgi:hypothetical protein
MLPVAQEDVAFDDDDDDNVTFSTIVCKMIANSDILILSIIA